MNVRTAWRFVTSVGILAIVAVGVPALLIAASTARFGSANPLAGVRPPWEWGWANVGEALSGPLADTAVIDGIVRLSLVVVWSAAAITVATTVGEFVHALRHRGLPMPDIRGAAVPQRIARFITVGLIAVLPLAAPTTSLASTLDARQAASSTLSPPVETVSGQSTADRAPTDHAPTDHTATDAVGRATTPERTERSVVSTTTRSGGQASTTSSHHPGVHIVGPGESIYSIAVAMAGTHPDRVAEIADAIIDANLGAEMPSGQRFTNPAYVEVGWSLTVPADVAAVAGGIHVVQPGDTLWDIADEQLGDPTEWPEIWDANAGDDMGGGRTFDDPNLILPGWELDLGNNEATPAAAPTEVAVEDTIDEIEVLAAPEVTEPDTTEPEATEPEVAGPEITEPEATEPEPTEVPSELAPATAVASTAPTTVATTAPNTAPSTTAVPTDGRDAGAGGPTAPAPGSEAPAPVRLEHAALLAAGVLALVGVRRRQRLRAAMPRHRVPEPHPDVSATERRLRSVGAGERSLRVDVACRAAAWSLIGTGCQIGWILASPDGAIELQLTGAASLPAPWVGADASWRLAPEAPVELLSEDARRVGQPCVALVQLGVTDEGDEVIVDLEAAGLLAIAAPTAQADEIVTAVAASLASSLFAEVAHLIGVSLAPAALLDHRNGHVTESSDAALDLATTLAGTTSANDRTSFELRSLRTGGEMWEPAVVMLCSEDGDESDREIDAIEPGHGLAVVVADEPRRFDEPGARLVADPDGWHLDAFGTTLAMTPIGVSDHDLADLADLLADAGRKLEPVEHDDPIASLHWAGAPELGSPSPGLEEPSSASPAASDAGASAESPGVEPDSAGAQPDTNAPFEPRPHEVVVGLLGAVEVRDRAGIAGSFERSKTVELIAWLATHRDRATRTGARTALWEMNVRDATFANVVSEARRKLARLVTPPEGEEWVGRTLTEQLPLHDLVVTDADLVEERLAHARLQPPSQAVETLRPAVEMVREMPFAGTGYLWPDAEGLTSNLVMLAITATAEFAAHALSLGDAESVFWATGHGLRVLSGHEELIGLRMRAHAHAGDLAGVRQEWESYERVLVADAWSDGEPAPHLLALRRELLEPTGS